MQSAIMRNRFVTRLLLCITATWTHRAGDAVLFLAAAAAAGVAGFALPAHADPALPDPGYIALDEGPPPLSVGASPKHLYTFGHPYRWPGGSLTWRYNDAGRPAGLSKSELIAGINAAAGQWMAACNVTIAQHAIYPETTMPAQTINGTAGSSDVNVFGWGDLSQPPAGNPFVSGVTFTSSRNGNLVDADTTFSTAFVTNASTLRRVAVHELGHALGLAHSNVEGQVMSGPGGSGNPGVPPTEYDGRASLQPDDIQGCLCLYGPSAANAGKGYLCELPSYRDFGSVPIGASSPVQMVTLSNGASAGAVTIDAITFSTPDYRGAGGCAPGTTLAPGGSCSFGMVFAPVSAVGSREAFVQIAADSLGPYAFPVIGTATGVPPRNYQGLWGNSPAGSESGWGISFAHQGDIIFATWFTYGADGKPLWLIAELNRMAADIYSGSIATVTGSAFDSVPFDSSRIVETIAGTMTVAFFDDNHASFAYAVNGTMQTKQITRSVFGPVPTCIWGAQPDLTRATNYQDLWSNAPLGSESGWGISFTHQGDIIFATWYTYDGDSKPLWLIAEARKVAPNVYSGPVSTVSGPAFDSVPFDSSKVVETLVGWTTLTFDDGNSATFSYRVNGVSQTKHLTRQVFRAPGTVCQ